MNADQLNWVVLFVLMLVWSSSGHRAEEHDENQALLKPGLTSALKHLLSVKHRAANSGSELAQPLVLMLAASSHTEPGHPVIRQHTNYTMIMLSQLFTEPLIFQSLNVLN